MNALISDNPVMAIWAMIIACILPFVFTIIAKVSAGFSGRDNLNPREALDQTTGLAARANATQKNSFETLPMFLVAVLVATYYFVPQTYINVLAWLYVGIRVIYGVAYLMNLAMLRSIIWMLSMVCIVQLFYAAIRVV